MDIFKKKKDDNPQTDNAAPEVDEAAPFKIKLQDGKACEKILTIEIGQDKIRGEYESYYHAIAPKANVPGFRPGRAPREVLEMHYEKHANDAVLEQLLSDSLPRALRDKKLRPLTTPELKDIRFSREKLSYKAHVEIRPRVKLSKVEGLSAKKEKAEVKDEEVEKSIQNLRERHCQYKVVDRPAAMGDFVIADYVCTIEGKELEKRKDDWIELKTSEYLKGFSEQLVGVKAGETREVRLTMPADMQNKNMAGKPATFKMEIKEVKEKILPEVDDDLAKQAGDYKDLTDLRDKLKQDLLKRLQAEKEAAFEQSLFDELLKHNKLDIPQGLLARRTEHLIEQAKQRFIYQGGTEELFDQEKEKARKEFEAEAKRQIHLAFLLDEIAEVQQITTGEADLKAKYAELAERYRQPAETIEKYYQEHKEALESLTDQVRNEKVIEYLKSNAKVN
ncbi:MAG: Trigger factor [Candidatus Omnitrophica bacterium ADurb.Bin277]|nr:MAG: Trigger factor [Candidatus Omnitrophica bacterium ADurb.Bin277]